MAKCPHLIRRVNSLYFRISVPLRLRPILQVRELTQTLHTQNRKKAIPAAYRLASEAKTLFNYIDSFMEERRCNGDSGATDEEYDLETLHEIGDVIKEAQLAESKKPSFGLKAMIALKRKDIAHDLEKEELQARHDAELKQALVQKELEFLRNAQYCPTPAPTIEPVKVKVTKAPKLSVVFDEYIGQYKGKGSKNGAEHKKKLIAVKKIFVSCLDDKQIDQITQIDVNQFFKLLVKYPGGRGGRTADFEGMTFLERIEWAGKNGTALISPKTFEDGYLNPANQFFEYIRNNHEDFAPILVTSHIDYEKYGGRREADEDKQRALKVAEIERLMCGDKMVGFAKSPTSAHKYWLVMIGLFTGARVAEICQINPQHDIVMDEKTGVWYFHLTDSTPSGAGIVKSYKNDASKRKVPIHSKLLSCGFIEYFSKIKAAGHDRIFHKFTPKDGSASYKAELFFRNYLRAVGLRDETVKKKVVGMHCLRSTFITTSVVQMMGRGLKQNQAISRIRPIVGHEEGALDENGADLSMTAGYIDKDVLKDAAENLSALQAIIEELDYGVDFPIAQ